MNFWRDVVLAEEMIAATAYRQEIVDVAAFQRTMSTNFRQVHARALDKEPARVDSRRGERSRGRERLGGVSAHCRHLRLPIISQSAHRLTLDHDHHEYYCTYHTGYVSSI